MAGTRTHARGFQPIPSVTEKCYPARLFRRTGSRTLLLIPAISDSSVTKCDTPVRFARRLRWAELRTSAQLAPIDKIRHDVQSLAQDENLATETVVADLVVTVNAMDSRRGTHENASVELSRSSSKMLAGGGGMRSEESLHRLGAESPRAGEIKSMRKVVRCAK